MIIIIPYPWNLLGGASGMGRIGKGQNGVDTDGDTADFMFLTDFSVEIASPQYFASSLAADGGQSLYYTHAILILFCTILYHTIPFHSVLFYTIPYHSIPYDSIPYHAILYYTIIY